MHLQNRFYSTTLLIGDGRALTLYGTATKSIETYTHGTGWAAPISVAPSMFVHEYYPWTYLLPDGKLFIAGPHVPTHRFEVLNPANFDSYGTVHGNRSTGGERGTAVMFTLRPPDYDVKIMIIGGSPSAAQQTSEIIDLSQPAPSVRGLNEPPVLLSQFHAVLVVMDIV